MRNLIGEVSKKTSVSLNRENVRDMVIRAAEVNEIKMDMQGRALFIKIDGCTRQHRSYLEVNVQFASPAADNVELEFAHWL